MIPMAHVSSTRLLPWTEGMFATQPTMQTTSAPDSDVDASKNCCAMRRDSLFMEVCFCLSQLIVMVWELEVLPSTVDVHLVTNDLAGHGAALNVPAWTTHNQHRDAGYGVSV